MNTFFALSFDTITNALKNTSGSPASNLALLIKTLFDLGLGFAALASLFVIIWSGFMYLFAGTKPGMADKAKKKLTKAVSGLVLALCSYLILSIINPALVQLRLPGLDNLQDLKNTKNIGSYNFAKVNGLVWDGHKCTNDTDCLPGRQCCDAQQNCKNDIPGCEGSCKTISKEITNYLSQLIN